MSDLVAKAHGLFLQIINLEAPDINYGLKAMLSTPDPERKRGTDPKDTCSIHLEFYPRGKGASSLSKLCDIQDLFEGKGEIKTNIQKTTQWSNRPVLVITMPHAKAFCAMLERIYVKAFERKAIERLLRELDTVSAELSGLSKPHRNEVLSGIVQKLHTKAQRHYSPDNTGT